MMETQLLAACKRLRLGGEIVANAKRIKKKGNLEFLHELFTAELEERDRKRRFQNPFLAHGGTCQRAYRGEKRRLSLAFHEAI